MSPPGRPKGEYRRAQPEGTPVSPPGRPNGECRRAQTEGTAMSTPLRILVIQGHPDPAGGHLGHALADAYAGGAQRAGHELRRVDIAQLDFPLLRSAADWEHGALPPSLQPAQDAIAWAEHLVMFFPLWMGDMPALLKAFLGSSAAARRGWSSPWACPRWSTATSSARTA